MIHFLLRPPGWPARNLKLQICLRHWSHTRHTQVQAQSCFKLLFYTFGSRPLPAGFSGVGAAAAAAAAAGAAAGSIRGSRPGRCRGSLRVRGMDSSSWRAMVSQRSARVVVLSVWRAVTESMMRPWMYAIVTGETKGLAAGPGMQSEHGLAK